MKSLLSRASSVQELGRRINNLPRQSRDINSTPVISRNSKLFESTSNALVFLDNKEKRKDIKQFLDEPLPLLHKTTKRSIQSSSRMAETYEKLAFRYEWITDTFKKSTEERAAEALEFLMERNFQWFEVESETSAALEQTVTDKNEIDFISFLTQVGNSLCPDEFAVGHFVQVFKDKGKIDNLLVLKELPTALNASSMENVNPDALFPQPKDWALMDQKDPLAHQEGRALLAIEDKYNITPSLWRTGAGDASMLERRKDEIRRYGAQLMAYVHRYYSEWLVINDGNHFFAFKFNENTLKTLSKVKNIADIPSVIEAEALEFKVDDIKWGLFTVLFTSLEAKFGQFNASTGTWSTGYRARGPVSLLTIPKQAVIFEDHLSIDISAGGDILAEYATA